MPNETDRCPRWLKPFWGDETRRGMAYGMAHFENVPKPMPMRNSTGAVVYYLFFASQKPVAEHIVTDIFNKYRLRGAT